MQSIIASGAALLVCMDFWISAGKRVFDRFDAKIGARLASGVAPVRQSVVEQMILQNGQIFVVRGIYCMTEWQTLRFCFVQTPHFRNLKTFQTCLQTRILILGLNLAHCFLHSSSMK